MDNGDNLKLLNTKAVTDSFDDNMERFLRRDFAAKKEMMEWLAPFMQAHTIGWLRVGDIEIHFEGT